VHRRKTEGGLGVLSDLIFEVVGRTKAERYNKNKKIVIYKINLSTLDGRHQLVLTDTDSGIIEQYPFGTAVNVSIGPNPQTTLKES
jgi:hypothetical protein